MAIVVHEAHRLHNSWIAAHIPVAALDTLVVQAKHREHEASVKDEEPHDNHSGKEQKV